MFLIAVKELGYVDGITQEQLYTLLEAHQVVISSKDRSAIVDPRMAFRKVTKDGDEGSEGVLRGEI